MVLKAVGEKSNSGRRLDTHELKNLELLVKAVSFMSKR